MPYRWSETAQGTRLTLWPHQSLTRRGFAWFIGVTAALFLMPLIAVLGSPTLWVLLGFATAAVAGVWLAITRNRHHRSGHEVLLASRDLVRLTHEEPGGRRLGWEANPYWVEVRLRAEGGRVENYLTLRGGGREVEIGAFLSPEERAVLKDELETLFARLRQGASG